jgi:hypothetical protein
MAQRVRYTPVRVAFSHVFRMQRSGAIRIDGVFP